MYGSDAALCQITLTACNIKLSRDNGLDSAFDSLVLLEACRQTIEQHVRGGQGWAEAMEMRFGGTLMWAQ